MHTNANSDHANARSGFGLVEDALLEFNICDNGLHVVANRSGWLDLARWCTAMASDGVSVQSTASGQHSGLELNPDLADSEAADTGRVITAFWGLSKGDLDSGRDVFFHRAQRIGPAFWEGTIVHSGNSPGTHLWSWEMLQRLEFLEGLTLRQAAAEIGTVVAQETPQFFISPSDAFLLRFNPESRDVLRRAVVEVLVLDGVVEGFGWSSREEMKESLSGM